MMHRGVFVIPDLIRNPELFKILCYWMTPAKPMPGQAYQVRNDNQNLGAFLQLRHSMESRKPGSIGE
jgi:hypothetical protein